MSWDAGSLLRIWDRGRSMPGRDPSEWRRDDYDNPIRFDEYGNRKSVFGWEVDHIDPDGGDGIANLRPLQWRINAGRN